MTRFITDSIQGNVTARCVWGAERPISPNRAEVSLTSDQDGAAGCRVVVGGIVASTDAQAGRPDYRFGHRFEGAPQGVKCEANARGFISDQWESRETSYEPSLFGERRYQETTKFTLCRPEADRTALSHAHLSSVREPAQRVHAGSSLSVAGLLRFVLPSSVVDADGSETLTDAKLTELKPVAR